MKHLRYFENQHETYKNLKRFFIVYYYIYSEWGKADDFTLGIYWELFAFKTHTVTQEARLWKSKLKITMKIIFYHLF